MVELGLKERETVMARKAKTRWSFAEDRRLIQLAASLKSLEAVAAELKRTPESVARSAKKLPILTRLAAVQKCLRLFLLPGSPFRN
jgi:hypothetical protein